MKIVLDTRYFVEDVERLPEFDRLVNNILSADKILKSENLNGEIRIELNLASSTNGGVIKGLHKSLLNLLLSNISIKYDPWISGPSASQRSALFSTENNHYHGCVVASFDGDQFKFSDRDSLMKIINYAERMHCDGDLFFIGKRDVPVRLGFNKKPDNYRQIHELVHSLTANLSNVKDLSKKTPEKVSLPYREIGESTPGFYMVNLSHPRYGSFLSDIGELTRISDLGQVDFNKRFTLDYFMTLSLGVKGEGLVSGYVHSLENPFKYISEDRETARVSSMILQTTRELSKTSVGPDLRKVIHNKKTLKILGKYFPKSDVSYALDLMNEGVL